MHKSKRNGFSGIVLWMFVAVVMPAPIFGIAQELPKAPPSHEIKIDENAFRWESRPAWVEPAPAVVPDADLLKRADPLYYALRDTQFLVDAAPALYVHQLLVANETSALSQLGQFEIDLVPAWQQLRLHAIHILRDGKSIDKQASTQIRFLERELGLEHGMYTGQVTASLLIDDVRVGDALDIEFTKLGRNPVFPDRFADAASWDLPTPTRLRRVVLKSPQSHKIQMRLFGPESLPEPKPQRRKDGSLDVLVFEGRDLVAAHPSGYYPAEYSPLRWIEFSEYRDWNEAAAWAAGLFKTTIPDASVVELANTLKSQAGAEARALAALQYVQREIRYFSISLGESSHRPSAPAVTLQRRYGDCKDKAALLIALLKELGIDAQPVLVPSQPGQSLGQKLPSPEHFDHVIVRAVVAGHEYFLDPTVPEQRGRLDAIYSWHEGVDVLIVAADTRQPTHLPTRKVDAAQFEMVEKMNIAAFDQPITLSIDAIARGQFADLVRQSLKQSTTEERTRESLAQITKRYEGAVVVGSQNVQDDSEKNVIIVSATYQLPAKAISDKNGLRFVKFRPTPIFGHLPIPEADRKVAMRISSLPQHYRYEFQLTAPTSVAEARDPQTKTIGKSYFTLQQQSRFRGNVASEIFDMIIPDGIVAMKDLEDYSHEIKKTEELRAVVFLPSGAGAGGKKSGGFMANLLGKNGKEKQADNAAPDPVAQRETEQRESLKHISASLDGNTLADRDRAAALIERGIIYDDLGESDKALVDFDAAIKLAPKNANAYYERGNSLLTKGRFKEAIDSFSRALALGVEDSDGVQTHRGIAEYFSADNTAALDDFAHGANGVSHSPYAMLWYLIAAERFAGGAKPGIVEASRRELGGEWPRPLYGLFTGDRTERDIEKLLAGANPAERKLNSCEAYFYIGEYFLSKHDVVNARIYFSKAIDTGVRFYSEYFEARHELERLDKASAP
ncbi:DUF3857 domain-containing protein [Pseudolysobacter antarcticus]|uniref:DUF3857 domain-containing protein n=1 Tax=Pseudolysobacter antarcticus TaxID=2511995 RepID=UPI0013ECC9CA|nr:DUF3857 domain-containing protein [Pseudolysobacter antarcticus]